MSEWRGCHIHQIVFVLRLYKCTGCKAVVVLLSVPTTCASIEFFLEIFRKKQVKRRREITA